MYIISFCRQFPDCGTLRLPNRPNLGSSPTTSMPNLPAEETEREKIMDVGRSRHSSGITQPLNIDVTYSELYYPSARVSFNTFASQHLVFV